MPTPFLRAHWRNLICINYTCDPAILQAYLPQGLELDLWNGRCYLSLVGFLFDQTRLKGIPIPFHTSFEEINLRAYVIRREGPIIKRGVIFIREIVPKYMISLVANTFYDENYITRKMKHQFIEENHELKCRYKVFDQRWHHLEAMVHPSYRNLRDGEEAQFILEHYWGYSGQKLQSGIAYEVRHPQWQIADKISYQTNIDFEILYGKVFAFLNTQTPSSAFFTKGSQVEVMPGKRF
ncbi:MAG: DUF2071 domain-containing protein [Chitinophagaceae bacterium]|jgi:uncharacterized protein YqjF (DUF2071 family)|nr:DUF2071 domain-containing protein [Chitinophagaceae bacterium]